MQAATNRVSLGQFQFIWKNIQMMRADKPSEFEAYNGYNEWKRNCSAPTSDQLRLEALVKQHFGEFDSNFDLPTQFLCGSHGMAHELIPCEGHAMYPGSHKWRFPTTMQAQCEKNGWDCVFDREYYLGDLNPYNPCGFEPREGGPIKLSQLDLARAKPSDYPRGISNCLVTEFDGFDTGSPRWKRPAFPHLTKTAARIRLGIDSSQTRASTMSAALAVTVVYPAALDAQCMRGKLKTPGLGSLAWENFLGDCLRRLSKLAAEKGILLMRPQAYCGLLRYEPTNPAHSRLFDQPKRFYWHAFDAYCQGLLADNESFVWESNVEGAVKSILEEPQSEY